MNTSLSRSRRLLLALAAGALVLCAGVRAEDRNTWSEHGGGPMVRGSGKVVTEPRSVAPFQGVQLKGGMRLVLRQAAKEAVEVRADDNIVGLIETVVTTQDGMPTLEIRSKKGASYMTHTPVVVTVDVVTLKALSLTGSGDASADGLKTGALKVDIMGAGDVQLRQLSADALVLSLSGSGGAGVSGRAGKLSITIAGSGDVAARELEADEVRVSIAGSGDARVNARRTLVVSIAGSGDVDYVGDATVRSSIAGSGSVNKR